MNTEIWKDIPGMEGQYQASSLGRIRSLSRYIPVNGPKGQTRRYQKGRILCLRPRDSTGHLAFDTKHGTTCQTHRLVAAAFLGPCPEGLLVLHNNGDPGDNRPENLRYGTPLENQRDVYYQGKRMKKLSLSDVEGIRFGFYCGYTDRELARLFGVQPCTINRIRNGKRFGWVTSSQAPYPLASE